MMKLDADFAVFAVFSPYPGTESFEEGARKGLYPADCWDRLMKDPLSGVKVPAAWNEHLNDEEILKLLKVAHRKFYYRPKVVGRTMLGLSSRQEFERMARGALSLVKMEMLSSKSRTAPV